MGPPSTATPSTGGLVQRTCDDRVEEQELLQRVSTSGAATGTGAPGLPGSLADARRKGGRPLGPQSKGHLEPRFGRSFDHVRIHTDGEASRLAAGLNAKAFTVGRDVFFGPGQYRPETSSGQRLIAHELVHTVQQSGGAVRVQRDLAEDATEIIDTIGGGASSSLDEREEQAIGQRAAYHAVAHRRYDLATELFVQVADLLTGNVSEVAVGFATYMAENPRLVLGVARHQSGNRLLRRVSRLVFAYGRRDLHGVIQRGLVAHGAEQEARDPGFELSNRRRIAANRQPRTFDGRPAEVQESLAEPVSAPTSAAQPMTEDAAALDAHARRPRRVDHTTQQVSAIEAEASASQSEEELAELQQARDHLLSAPQYLAPLLPHPPVLGRIRRIATWLESPLGTADRTYLLRTHLLVVREWLQRVGEEQAFQHVGLPAWTNAEVQTALMIVDGISRHVERAGPTAGDRSEPPRADPLRLYDLARLMLRGRQASDWEIFAGADAPQIGAVWRTSTAEGVEGVHSLEEAAAGLRATLRDQFGDLVVMRQQFFGEARRDAVAANQLGLVRFIDMAAEAARVVSVVLAAMAGFGVGFVRIALLLIPGVYGLLELTAITVQTLRLELMFEQSRLTGDRMSREDMDTLERRIGQLTSMVRSAGDAVRAWRRDFESAPSEEGAYMLGDLIAQLVAVVGASRSPRGGAAQVAAGAPPPPAVMATTRGTLMPAPVAAPAVAGVGVRVPTPPLSGRGVITMMANEGSNTLDVPERSGSNATRAPAEESSGQPRADVAIGHGSSGSERWVLGAGVTDEIAEAMSAAVSPREIELLRHQALASLRRLRATDLSQLSQAEVEAIAAARETLTISGRPAANTADHMALAWQSYEVRTHGAGYGYARWRNTYLPNQTRAVLSTAAAERYRSTLGWPRRELTLTLPDGRTRRLDMADPARLLGAEYKVGYVSMDSFTTSEIARDAILVRDLGWRIHWRVNGRASEPAREALREAGIPLQETHPTTPVHNLPHIRGAE